MQDKQISPRWYAECYVYGIHKMLLYVFERMKDINPGLFFFLYGI